MFILVAGIWGVGKAFLIPTLVACENKGLLDMGGQKQIHEPLNPCLPAGRNPFTNKTG